MSKAFVNEDSENEKDDEQELEGPEKDLPAGSKNYITPRGAEKLKLELRHLIYQERPEIVQKVTWAASLGDRSENADYHYNKKRLREIDRRIRFLGKKIENLQIIDPSTVKSDHVLFGATVEIEHENAERRIIKIVGIDEVNVEAGQVSWISPIGRALLQGKVGEYVLLKTPRGAEELLILKISYLSISDE